MKLKQLACLAALSIPFTANADFLSVTAGGGVWFTSPDGSIEKTGDPLSVDVDKNLFWDNESPIYLFATFEHFVPLVPNAKLMYTKIDQSGSGNTSFTFNGDSFTGNVSNDFSIESTDLVLYYEILDNIVSLDIGLDIRNLKVDYNISSTGITTKDSVEQVIPMAYALVGGSPWPGLIISGEISYIGYSGNSISDITAKVAYTTDYFIGFEAGYRRQQYKLDDISNTNANLTFDGVFAGAYVKF